MYDWFNKKINLSAPLLNTTDAPGDVLDLVGVEVRAVGIPSPRTSYCGGLHEIKTCGLVQKMEF